MCSVVSAGAEEVVVNEDNAFHEDDAVDEEGTAHVLLNFPTGFSAMSSFQEVSLFTFKCQPAINYKQQRNINEDIPLTIYSSLEPLSMKKPHPLLPGCIKTQATYDKSIGAANDQQPRDHGKQHSVLGPSQNS